MTPLSDEARLIIVQLFVDDRDETGTTIHPKKKEKKRGALMKELQQLRHDYEEIESDIDLEPYQEAETFLRKVTGEVPYQEFIDKGLRPYMN